MKVNDKLTMTELYSKLEKLGFSKEFIRAIGLPSWWVDKLDQSISISVAYEAASYIAKRLPIDLKSLIDITQEAKFRTWMLYDEITYEGVIEILRKSKQYLVQHPLTDRNVSYMSDDTLDYHEQLLVLDV